MVKLNGSRAGAGSIHVADGVPRAFVHGAEGAAGWMAEALETAGARVAKGAATAGDKASELSGQIASQVSQAANQVSHAQLDGRRSQSGLRRRLSTGVTGLASKKRTARFNPAAAVRANTDALLNAQLAKTSRELAQESSELSQAIDSLNALITSNRKAVRPARRLRLIGGLTIGAAVMYHFDAENGRRRRAATRQRLAGLAGRH